MATGRKSQEEGFLARVANRILARGIGVIRRPWRGEGAPQMPGPGFCPNWLAGRSLKSEGLEGSSEARSQARLGGSGS